MNRIDITPSMLTNEQNVGDEQKLIGSEGFWFPGWDNFPASVKIDLGEKYLIDTIQFNDVEGEGDYMVEIESNGEWLLLWEGKTDKSGLYEKKTLAYTQYLRLTLLEAGANINGFKVYGKRFQEEIPAYELQLTQDGQIINTIAIADGVDISIKKIVDDDTDETPDNGNPNPNPNPNPSDNFRKTLDQAIQTNVLLDDPSDLVKKVSAGARGYQYLKWLQKDVSNVNTGAPLSQVKINFNPIDAFSMNLDEKVKAFAENGDFYLTLFESAMYLTNNDKTWLNAVAYKRSDGRNGLDNPNRWKYVSHLYFQVAARYGQTQVDSSKLITDSPKVSGLGYCKYIEGANEKDRWWIGSDKANLSPEEHAAYYSAVYDGHMNTMSEPGVFFGVKNADPQIKLMLGGLAYVNFDELLSTGKVDWFERFFSWFENNRKDANYDTYPIDVITYHDYANTERKQRNLSGQGLDPEAYKWYEKTSAFIQYIRTRCPKALEVDCNEFGYDRNQSSPQRAVPYAGFNSEQVAGMFTVRQILEGWAAGHTRMAQFYFRDNNSNGGGIFQSSGLTDKSNGYRPFQMFYYMATLRHAGEDLEFVAREVSGDMIKYTCKNKSTGKNAYILWFFSKSNKKQNYSITVSSNSVQEIRIVDNSETGQISNKSASGGKVDVLVSEMPTFVLE